MNIAVAQNHSRSGAGSRSRVLFSGAGGFTLSEIMVAMAIFSLVVIGVVYSHIFGLKMFNITATKLTASQGARAALNRVRDEIRSAKTVYVGNGNRAGFASVTGNAPRQGNAVRIVPSANTNISIWYYVDPQDEKLKRATTNQLEVIASFITNQVAFYAEDYLGNVLTNDQNNRVIKMSLEFYQWEFPVTRVGAYYDYYHLQTRITRRAIE